MIALVNDVPSWPLRSRYAVIVAEPARVEPIWSDAWFPLDQPARLSDRPRGPDTCGRGIVQDCGVRDRRRLPWAKPRFELVLLVLVAAAALSPVYTNSVQDASRLCLTRALEHGRVVISPCIGGWSDRAVYDGRLYSDKAPGM